MLFLIYINDAPIINHVKNVIFADDKGLITNSYRVDTIVKRLSDSSNKNVKFFEKWKIKTNNQKVKAIVFTKRRPFINNNISVSKSKIPWYKNVKYLGIIFDPKLTFTCHINSITNKAIAMLILFHPLLNRNSKLSVDNKLNIYKMIVRPIICYAAPVWSLISKSNFNKLQVVQNKFLRLIGKFRKFTPIHVIHNKLGVEMIHSYIRNLSINYFNKIENHNNQLISSIRYVNSKYKHKKIMHIIYNN